MRTSPEDLDVLHCQTVAAQSGTIGAEELSSRQAADKNRNKSWSVTKSTHGMRDRAESQLTRLTDLMSTYKFDEEVFAERQWRLVLVDDILHLTMMLDVAFEQVERRVVSVVDRVLDVLLERDFEPAP